MICMQKPDAQNFMVWFLHVVFAIGVVAVINFFFVVHQKYIEPVLKMQQYYVIIIIEP